MHVTGILYDATIDTVRLCHAQSTGQWPPGFWRWPSFLVALWWGLCFSDLVEQGAMQEAAAGGGELETVKLYTAGLLGTPMRLLSR